MDAVTEYRNAFPEYASHIDALAADAVALYVDARNVPQPLHHFPVVESTLRTLEPSAEFWILWRAYSRALANALREYDRTHPCYGPHTAAPAR